ncbi:M1 family peptidase, partial [Mucilaginibacter sp. 5C4]|nr:M1 family peptidase [Mucilaginibacter sp. 5C4]
MYDTKNFFYELSLTNRGGCEETEKISAYIWRHNEQKITKVFAKNKEVRSIKLDPERETADIDEGNNSWPKEFAPTRFELFKQQTLPRGATSGANPMQESRKVTQ